MSQTTSSSSLVQTQEGLVPDTYRAPIDFPALPPVPDAPPVQRWQRMGLVIVIGGLGGFLLWASLFSLAGGAYATGMVRLSDEKQVVAHHQGGVVRRLLVSEGDKVKAGQELVVLDDYASETDLSILEKRRIELLARKARLEAVRDGLGEILFPVELTTGDAIGNTLIEEALAVQQRQFKAEKEDIDGKKNILTQQVAQYDTLIQSLADQIKSGERQLALIQEEVDGVEKLLARGLERKPRLLGLKRQQEGLESQNADYAGRIASTQEKIGEAKLQMANLDTTARSGASADLAQLMPTLTQTIEQWQNARLRSRELTLRAAHDGTVLNLRYKTTGAIVTPATAIMEVVPSSKVFVVDAKLMPSDIDVVHEGLPAQIRLSGLKQRTHVTLNGSISRVSPDALIDERSGMSYFEIRATFDQTDPEFKKLQEQGELYAGMPGDIIAIAHKRTLMQYLMQPIADSFSRSFHED